MLRDGHGRKCRNRFEILRGPQFENKIYVKGMLIQAPAHSYGGRAPDDKFFGYNLLVFDMKHRDRQNSITANEEKRAVVEAWYTHHLVFSPRVVLSIRIILSPVWVFFSVSVLTTTHGA